MLNYQRVDPPEIWRKSMQDILSQQILMGKIKQHLNQNMSIFCLRITPDFRDSFPDATWSSPLANPG